MDLHIIEQRIINHLMMVTEGGDKYTNDPDDNGGGTKYGITEAVAREFGYKGHMRDLPYVIAYSIYFKKFWLGLSLAEILVLHPKMEIIVKELLDTSVNMGVGVGATFLQRALNVSNRNEQDYKDIKVDGKIGPNTIKALDNYIKRNGILGLRKLYISLNILQGNKYFSICENNPKQEKWFNGWMARVMEEWTQEII